MRFSSCVVKAVVPGLVLLASMIAPGQTMAQPRFVTIEGEGSAHGETLIAAPMALSFGNGNYVYRLQPGNISAQIVVIGKKAYFYTVLKPGTGKFKHKFALETDSVFDDAKAGVKFRRAGTNLDVRVTGKPLSTYRTDEPSKPYFYPLIGPTGDEFTRAYPMRKDVAGEAHDHPHQRSFWFTHGNVNGVDFWASDPINKPNPKFGSIRETSRRIAAEGPVVGVLQTTDEWLGPDGKKVCDDERLVRVYSTGATRVIDFEIVIKATAGPVTFGDTKEGMFGLRVASSMDVKNKTGGKITNAEGVTDDAAWGKASPWVDYTGPVNGKTVGVAILNHPDSFRYPTTWHVRTYGLFAANPFGWHDFGRKESGAHTTPEGGSIGFRYRVILHEGETAPAHIADAFRSYSEPATVVYQKE